MYSPGPERLDRAALCVGFIIPARLKRGGWRLRQCFQCRPARPSSEGISMPLERNCRICALAQGQNLPAAKRKPKPFPQAPIRLLPSEDDVTQLCAPIASG